MYSPISDRVISWKKEEGTQDLYDTGLVTTLLVQMPLAPPASTMGKYA